MSLHIHKQLTDSCDLVQIANEFIVTNPEKRNYFESITNIELS